MIFSYLWVTFLSLCRAIEGRRFLWQRSLPYCAVSVEQEPSILHRSMVRQLKEGIVGSYFDTKPVVWQRLLLKIQKFLKNCFQFSRKSIFARVTNQPLFTQVIVLYGMTLILAIQVPRFVFDDWLIPKFFSQSRFSLTFCESLAFKWP